MVNKTSYHVLEFYSGIGGWKYALSQSGASFRVVGAFDINTIANDVYTFNDTERLQPSPRNIETISVKYIESLQANMWVLSPPCQPFTRNNQTDHRDEKDPRSRSFKHLMTVLEKLKSRPICIGKLSNNRLKITQSLTFISSHFDG